MKKITKHMMISQVLTAGIAMIIVMVIFYAGIMVGKALIIYQLLAM